MRAFREDSKVVSKLYGQYSSRGHQSKVLITRPLCFGALAEAEPERSFLPLRPYLPSFIPPANLSAQPASGVATLKIGSKLCWDVNQSHTAPAGMGKDRTINVEWTNINKNDHISLCDQRPQAFCQVCQPLAHRAKLFQADFCPPCCQLTEALAMYRCVHFQALASSHWHLRSGLDNRATQATTCRKMACSSILKIFIFF